MRMRRKETLKKIYGYHGIRKLRKKEGYRTISHDSKKPANNKRNGKRRS
jgi:hypothetical protein